MSAAIWLVPWILVLAIFIIRKYAGKPTPVTLLEYQGGIIFKQGCPVREVEPGKHWVWVGKEKLIIVDKRPTSFNFENRAVALSDGATAIYGFTGSAGVRNISKVLYCARNYNHLPAFVLACSVRMILNTYPSGSITVGQEDVPQKIIRHAEPKLAEAGFDLQTFRFTHLSVASPPPDSEPSLNDFNNF